MATKETIWDAVSSMATVWKFPKAEDLNETAAAYHFALRDLSDEEIMGAVQSLLASWSKASPPKPADIRTTAVALRPSPSRAPRLPRPEPTHDEIMLKVRRDTYHVRAIREVLGEERKHTHPKFWTAEERRKIGARQAQYRQELGLPTLT